ncbi:MAG: GNAT family N-acetyltransferase [Actinobacteria bacterium]|nr:GNAT family N-acetyltransferase [Actinomycetota bacterium]
MTRTSRHTDHSARTTGSLRLYGRRVMLRPLVAPDFPAWSEVRRRNHDWLTVWEPQRVPYAPDPSTDRDAFTSRCNLQERDRQTGVSYAFGLFVDNAFAGQVNLNNVVRGALQSGTIGYWIDQARAGHGYVAEAVAVVLRYAFEELDLHRVEICIVPRNHNSHRVMEKLDIRNEGTAMRFLEINGVWEDHVRYGITTEEWAERRDEFARAWLTSAPT